jgi:hypothetical protein
LALAIGAFGDLLGQDDLALGQDALVAVMLAGHLCGGAQRSQWSTAPGETTATGRPRPA